MDFGNTLSRALKIVRENKVLWILGFLSALGGAATTFGNNSRWNTSDLSSSTVLPDWMMRPGVMVAGIGLLILFAFVLGLVFYVVGLIARGGLIKGVRLIETEGQTSFKSAWLAGAGKFWSLLGLTLLLFLPFIILGVIATLILVTSGLAIFAPLIGGENMPQNNMVAGGIAIAVLALTLGCAAVVYGLVALGLQTLGERAIMLDNLPVMEALRKARSLLRAQLGNIILLALIVFLIDLAVSIVTGFVVALFFVPVAATLIVDQTPQTATFVFGAIGLVAAMLVGALIGAIFNAFNSTVWTLAYEQFTGTVTIAPSSTSSTLAHPA